MLMTVTHYDALVRLTSEIHSAERAINRTFAKILRATALGSDNIDVLIRRRNILARKMVVTRAERSAIQRRIL